MDNDFYHQYIQSPEWKAKAAAAKLRAGNKCEYCGSTDHLAVHHLNYDYLGDEEPEDIILLCRGCHFGEGAIRHESSALDREYRQIMGR